MTSREAGHADFDELAAGYALNALECPDEQRFLRHAAGCPRCQGSIARFRAVAAALAETAPPAEPGDHLGERILAATRPGPDRGGQPGTAGANEDSRRQGDAGGAVTGMPGVWPGDAGEARGDDDGGSAVGERNGRLGSPRGTVPAPGPATLPPGVVRLRPRQRWMRGAAVAAAAALIAGGGMWAGLTATAGGPPAPLAACAHPHACTQVVLTVPATRRVAAKVIVHDGVAWMEPAAMAANPAGEIYVLWQITGSRPPLPVGSFDVRAGAHSPIKIGGLAAPYAGTSAFAVSLEHGRAIPTAPSDKVALGQVS
jgi:hypothetical protein